MDTCKSDVVATRIVLEEVAADMVLQGSVDEMMAVNCGGRMFQPHELGYLMDLVEPHDEPVLVHLNDPDNAGFAVNFSFKENPYFTRKRLPEAIGCILSMDNGMLGTMRLFTVLSLNWCDCLGSSLHLGWTM